MYSLWINVSAKLKKKKQNLNSKETLLKTIQKI